MSPSPPSNNMQRPWLLTIVPRLVPQNVDVLRPLVLLSVRDDHLCLA